MGTGCEKVKNCPSAFRVKSRSHAISPCLRRGFGGGSDLNTRWNTANTTGRNAVTT